MKRDLPKRREEGSMGQCNAVPDCAAQDGRGNSYIDEDSSDENEPAARRDTASLRAHYGSHKSEKVPKRLIDGPVNDVPRNTNADRRQKLQRGPSFESSAAIQHPRDTRSAAPPAAVAPKTYQESPYARHMAAEVSGAGGVRVTVAEDERDAQDREAHT